MTYALVLLLFVLAPILALSIAILLDRLRMRPSMARTPLRAQLATLLALLAVATLYTIPWDDHLIALGVWWYDHSLLLGVYFGHIPVEEALFFPFQTLLVGVWWIWLSGRLRPPSATLQESGQSYYLNALRYVALAAGLTLWLGALAMIALGWRPGTYLGWQLAWALPPLMLQIFVGGSILWRSRRLLAWLAVPVALYLSCVDALAIHLGIWTVDPRQSLGMVIAGWLPIEELLFFSLTSALVSFGLVLGVSAELRKRSSGLTGRMPWEWRARLAAPGEQTRKDRAHGLT